MGNVEAKGRKRRSKVRKDRLKTTEKDKRNYTNLKMEKNLKFQDTVVMQQDKN